MMIFCRRNGRSAARLSCKVELRNLGTGGGVVVHPEVSEALAAGRAVVALESTIISHGMPYPANLECARACEAAVRAHGAVPATVAVIGGVPRVGLDDEALDHLAQAGHSCTKTSRRDMASVVARGADGATTVAGTMVLAHMAGIEVFATGGIGGVHRGAEASMDISADLTELGRTPIAVVCAGVKSILDIGLTLEYLETQGVAVATIGSKVFPSFYTVNSGFSSPATLADPAAAAAQLHAAAQLGLQSGTLFAVPNPSPPEDEEALEAAVTTALAECKSAGVSGKDVTPFLLARVTELTSGDSLASNVELVLNNSVVAAKVAVALSEQRSTSAAAGTIQAPAGNSSTATAGGARTVSSAELGAPVVVGGSTTDIVSRPNPGTPLIPLTSSPGIVTQSMGGVARGISEALGQAGWRPLLISAVGTDLAGEALIVGCEAAGIATEGILRDATGQRSAVYAALHDADGELSAAIADMDIFDNVLSPAHVQRYVQYIEAAPIVVMDANPPVDTMQALGEMCVSAGVPLWYEPTSIPKSSRLLHAPAALRATKWLSPNLHELSAMAEAAAQGATGAGVGFEELSREVAVAVQDVLLSDTGEQGSNKTMASNLATLLQAMVGIGDKGPTEADRRHVFVSLGSSGLLWVDAVWLPIGRAPRITVTAKHYPAIPVDTVVSVTGAGDSFVAAAVRTTLQLPLPQHPCNSRLPEATPVAHATQRTHHKGTMEGAVQMGLRASAACVGCEDAIAPGLVALDAMAPAPIRAA